MGEDVSSRAEERKRRSERVLLRIPIQVKGTGEDGKPFSEKTHTVIINRHGARIASKNSLQPEAHITITNLQNMMSCPFRVVGRTGKSLGEGPEWGVECLEPEVNFWGISFPAKTAVTAEQELIDVLLECSACQARELAQLTLEQYRSIVTDLFVRRDCSLCAATTEWKFGFVEGEPEGEVTIPSVPAPSAPAPPDEAERRRAKRVTIKLPVRVRLQDGREEVARTENLSKTGVCFIADLVMNVGERILLTVGYTSAGSEKEIPARVMWRRQLEATDRALYGVHLEDGD